ncbi:hypothetical protein QJS04_geneDACA024242 [Acorus gramineus]|uniref:Uncharacterized protein n=1 Tax=Acorus gramineus TaxID=55184 RepID=A0AAV9AMZ6_ACOGR|nr:hypothetical protein QJS04_geneDACA024242 [Acorus gramineus]
MARDCASRGLPGSSQKMNARRSGWLPSIVVGSLNLSRVPLSLSEVEGEGSGVRSVYGDLDCGLKGLLDREWEEEGPKSLSPRRMASVQSQGSLGSPKEKSYETKQYKKGLKAADAILKKYPEHGGNHIVQTIRFHLNGRAHSNGLGDWVDRKKNYIGCSNRLKDRVNRRKIELVVRPKAFEWSMCNLMEYREAIKCYRNALKIDSNNIEILRDLSLLQAQMRDLSGFVETRQHLLSLKPNHRMNWIGFAVAQHLNSNGSKAIEILEAYEGTLEDDYPSDNERCEHGEMLLYKISLMEEHGFYERALDELYKKEAKIVDKLAYKEQQVSLLEKLGRTEEGEKVYKILLFMNPDNYRYYSGLQKCLGLYSEKSQFTSDEADRLCALYKELREQYKWSSAVRRIPLDFLQFEKFREAAENYIRPLLTKGVPSLFSDLSPLYDQPGKADILEKVILDLENSIRSTGGFPGRMSLRNFITLQHYDRRGQCDIALAKINVAIEHTPTVIDLYSVKSRILKHAGDLPAAANLADEARSMDLADRFLNSECVKRMLQADQVDLAEKTVVLFTKEGDQHNNLHDMQCMWYELASGESYLRQGDLGRALKNFLAVEKHYADITEDQFDFHSYCLRKMTLRAYVRMLKFQDHLHAHPYFHKAAAGAIRCYMKLYDSPPKSAAEEDDESSKLLPSQKKKLKQKQKKAEARARKEAEEKNEEESNTSNTSKSGKRQPNRPVDLDPHGEKLLQVENPLQEATKYLKLLQKNSAESMETHLLSFELNMRKQKVLLAFQALKQLLKLDPDNPDSHCCLIRFFHKVSSFGGPVTDSEKLISKVFEVERPMLSQLHEKTLVEANRSLLEKHTDSLMHRAAVAEMLHLLEPNKKIEAIKLIEDSANRTVAKNGALGPVLEWSLKDCISVHKLLETVLIDLDAASRWKVRCAEYFPCSSYFEGIQSSATSLSTEHAEFELLENGGIIHAETENRNAHSLNGKLASFKHLAV